LGVVLALCSARVRAGTKNNLIYARDHSVEEGLKYEATWNMVMLQTEDLGKSAKAFMSKQPPRFAKP
jgi:enoyl-CoA hydratase/carnithine racemase